MDAAIKALEREYTKISTMDIYKMLSFQNGAHDILGVYVERDGNGWSLLGSMTTSKKVAARWIAYFLFYDKFPEFIDELSTLSTGLGLSGELTCEM